MTNFGEKNFPCSSKDAPYCIQSNGQFNPGTCSKNETEVVKCVPANDADFKDRDVLLSCLVQNSEDFCILDKQCRWEGEKTQCHDTPAWKAYKGGVTCSMFAQRYCEKGDIKLQYHKFSSS